MSNCAYYSGAKPAKWVNFYTARSFPRFKASIWLPNACSEWQIANKLTSILRGSWRCLSVCPSKVLSHWLCCILQPRTLEGCSYWFQWLIHLSTLKTGCSVIHPNWIYLLSYHICLIRPHDSKPGFSTFHWVLRLPNSSTPSIGCTMVLHCGHTFLNCSVTNVLSSTEKPHYTAHT